MKKFKFRLESVLETRKKHLENCQLELAKVKNKLSSENQILENLYQTTKESRKSVNKMLKSKENLDFTITHTFRNYLNKVEEDISLQKRKIKLLEKELDEKNQTVIEALKAKTMLEKLKEKEYKAYIANIEKLDLMEIDEIANRKRAMNSLFY